MEYEDIIKLEDMMDVSDLLNRYIGVFKTIQDACASTQTDDYLSDLLDMLIDYTRLYTFYIDKINSSM